MFGGSNHWTNRLTAIAPQPVPTVSSGLVRYQFRFRIPGEEICIVRPPQTSPRIFMNWSDGLQLECSQQYEVDVRVSLDGGTSWCIGAAIPSCSEPVTPWGKVCMVNITSSTDCPGELKAEAAASHTRRWKLHAVPEPEPWRSAVHLLDGSRRRCEYGERGHLRPDRQARNGTHDRWYRMAS